MVGAFSIGTSKKCK